MKKWLLATRPWSFTASVIPLTLGAALAWASDAAHAGLFLLTLLGGVAVQTGTNMLNTYGDYRSGVDTEASAHGESPILLGLISPEAMRRGGLIALCVAFAVGIVLGFACGWPILAFGLVGIAGGYGYTSGFWPYKYHACGPIMVFLLMGPLMALPAYYIQGGSLDWRPFLASLPIACLVTSIMHANDIRDIAHDREAGITTLAMLLGRRKALYLYATLCVGAYGVLLLLAAFGVLPLSGLLPFVLAPGLWRTLRTLGTRPLPESELVSLDGVSARHHFLFGLLLIAGILLPRGLELAQGLIRGYSHDAAHSHSGTGVRHAGTGRVLLVGEFRPALGQFLDRHGYGGLGAGPALVLVRGRSDETDGVDRAGRAYRPRFGGAPLCDLRARQYAFRLAVPLCAASGIGHLRYPP
ncbi:MAG: 1,4-dihydroxy-2-naphthoate octaprenyltransferase [Bilophila wadsworthia]|uniref:1,4-dihydroxy-2-naphthoate octaprenyltransferase n=1 Tax=Bilophila wadsworthia TaxID=35833 RepID=UPI00300F71E2